MTANRLRQQAALVACLSLLVLSCVSSAFAVTRTYNGGGGNPNDWSDNANWNGLSFPTAGDDAIVPNGFSPSFINVPASIRTLTTGNTAVTVNAALTFGGVTAGPTAGTGGLTFTGGLLFPNGGAVINAAGNLSTPSLGWGNTGSIAQTGGQFNIASFNLPIAGAVSINAYQFAGTTPTSISSSTPSASYTLTGTPVFQGSHRPNWDLSSGFSNGTSGVWNLNGFTMLGNTINVTAGGSPTNRYSTLSNTVAGGQIDANILSVGNVTYAAPYLDFTAATTVTLRGAGTIYNNFSVNNDGTGKSVAGNATTWPRPFKADTSTFIFDPAAGSASIDTGSSNLGLAGFANNFALGNVTLGAGDTITLTGNQNVGGSANNALYVADTLRGLNGSTLALATREAFVDGALEIGSSPGQFTVSNGNLHLTNNAEAHFEINGPTVGTDYDQLIFAGGGTLSLGGATLDLDLNGPVASGLYFLVDNQSPNAISGIFAGLPDGATVPVGNSDVLAFISYSADIGSNQFTGGNDIALQLFVVPEPGTWTLLALGALGLAWRARRRGGLRA